MTASTAHLRVDPDGRMDVDALLRLTDGSHIRCCTYAEQAPILSLDDRCVSVSITVPDCQKVTSADLDSARRLADAVADYITGLERRIKEQEAADHAA